VCRARKTEIYAQVEQLRLRLSDFDKKRMENRKYHLEGRSLKFSDVKSLDEHVASLKKALKEGNTEAQTQIDSTTSDRSKVIAFESFLKSETKQEEQSAGFRVQIEGLNAENQTLRKKEQQFMAAISDLSKNEDVFSQQIIALSNERKAIFEEKRKVSAELSTLQLEAKRLATRSRRSSIPELALLVEPTNAPVKAAPARDFHAAEKAAVDALIIFLRGLLPTRVSLAKPDPVSSLSSFLHHHLRFTPHPSSSSGPYFPRRPQAAQPALQHRGSCELVLIPITLSLTVSIHRRRQAGARGGKAGRTGFSHEEDKQRENQSRRGTRTADAAPATRITR
jgi:hypothetical protein